MQVLKAKKQASQKIEDFIDNLLIDGKSERTAIVYKQELMRIEAFIDKPLHDATTSDLSRYIASITALAPASRAQKISTIRSFFNWLVDIDEYRMDNPARKFRTPKLEEALPQYLEHEEVLRVKSYIKDPYLKVLFEVMYATGIRISEAIGMNRIDVLWNMGKIRIRHGKGNKQREVPISSTTLASLRSYVDNRTDDNEALLVNRHGERWCARTVQYHFQQLRKKADVEGVVFTPHKLRHSCFTTLRNNGVGIDAIKTWAGHESWQTTTRYAKIIDAKQVEMYANAVPKGM